MAGRRGRGRPMGKGRGTKRRTMAHPNTASHRRTGGRATAVGKPQLTGNTGPSE